MAYRGGDWLAQAEKDLEHATRSRAESSHEWACFAAQQAVDLVAIVSHSPRPFAERSLDRDATALPVPAEILIYTLAEWRAMSHRGGWFIETLASQTVWVLARGGADA